MSAPVLEIHCHPATRMVWRVAACLFLCLMVTTIAVMLLGPDGSVAGALLIGGFWAAWFALSVYFFYDRSRRHLVLSGLGIGYVRLFSQRRMEWGDVATVRIEKNDELQYCKVLIEMRCGKVVLFSPAECPPDGRESIEALVSALPKRERPAFELVDRPRLKREVFWHYAGLIMVISLSLFFGNSVTRGFSLWSTLIVFLVIALECLILWLGIAWYARKPEGNQGT